MAPFASVEELQNSLRLTNLPAATALLALKRASSLVRGHCHWGISREVVVSQTQPPMTRWSSRLFLPTLHLVSVESVVEAGQVLGLGLDYRWTQAGVLYRGGYWAISDVVVSYTHGYDVDDYRYDLAKDATLRLAAKMVDNPAGHASEQTGSEGWTVRAPTPDEQEEAFQFLGPLVMESIG